MTARGAVSHPTPLFSPLAAEFIRESSRKVDNIKQDYVHNIRRKVDKLKAVEIHLKTESLL